MKGSSAPTAPLYRWADKEAAFAEAVRRYDSGDAGQRHSSLFAMSRLDYARAVPYFERSALDDDRAVRWRAVRQLSRRLDRAHWPIYVEVAKSNSLNAYVAIHALRELATPEDRAALRELATQVAGLRRRRLRRIAKRLWDLEEVPRVPCFVEVVRAGSSDAHVAFRALKRLATPQDGPALQQLSTEVGGVHRRNLRKLLRRIEAT